MKRYSRKEQILKVACKLFAKHGFNGAHFRNLCKLARANNAMIAYYFGDKQGLCHAVQAKARERLSSGASGSADLGFEQLPPKKRLEVIITRLFERLSEDSGWIAQLATRELVEAKQAQPSLLMEGLRDYLVLLETAINQAVGPAIDAATVRIEALSILSQCVINSLPEGIFNHMFLTVEDAAFRRDKLVEHLTRACLLGLYANTTFDQQHPAASEELVPPPKSARTLAAPQEKAAVGPRLPGPR